MADDLIRYNPRYKLDTDKMVEESVSKKDAVVDHDQLAGVDIPDVVIQAEPCPTAHWQEYERRTRWRQTEPQRVYPVPGRPNLYTVAPAGPILNKAHANPREVLIDLDRKYPGAAVGFAAPSQRYFVIENVEMLLHPWPELIQPSLNVSVEFYTELVLSEQPLMSLARPMTEPNPELDERIRKLEAEVEKLKNNNTEPARHFLLPNAQIKVRLYGDADALTIQMEMLKHCRCRVAGWEVNPTDHNTY